MRLQLAQPFGADHCGWVQECLVYFLPPKLMRWREMITMPAMSAFAKREAKGYPPPPYTPTTCAMIEQLPMQQKQMQTGSVRMRNSMFRGVVVQTPIILLIYMLLNLYPTCQPVIGY